MTRPTPDAAALLGADLCAGSGERAAEGEPARAVPDLDRIAKMPTLDAFYLAPEWGTAELRAFYGDYGRVIERFVQDPGNETRIAVGVIGRLADQIDGFRADAAADQRAVNDLHATLTAELAEARAELAAERGEPEGALPGWEMLAGRYVRRPLPEGGALVIQFAGLPGRRWRWYAACGVGPAPLGGYAGGVRDAMRAADDAARAADLLPAEVADASR